MVCRVVFTEQKASSEALKKEIGIGDYQVLARTYRPKNFSDIIGQDDCVQILTHALQTHRVGHAFLFVGERGVGKTTLARLLARALNCTGEKSHKGTAGVEPCGVCVSCRDIDQDRQMDILEMDAASHTGVDDVRAIIEGARYRPATLRYKVFIIDEVHMLSKSAFNALLKTLEEPPPHVKFIFATTELQKVPLTIRSRCQFFNLKRMAQGTLEAYFKAIAQKEGVAISEGALKLIAKGADGSVRDGLSLLDHAFNFEGSTTTKQEIKESQVRQMFGLCDLSDIIQLFTRIMSGDQETVLSSLDEYVALGQDPQKIVQDLLEICYHMTRYKCSAAYDLSFVPKEVQAQLKGLSSQLSMEVLHRAWQVLGKGLEEVRLSSMPDRACGMVLIRLMFLKGYISSLDLGRGKVDSLGEERHDSQEDKKKEEPLPLDMGAQGDVKKEPVVVLEIPKGHEETVFREQTPIVLKDFEQVLAFLLEHKEVRLYTDLYAHGRFVSLEGHTLTLSLQEFPERALLKQKLEKAMEKHTRKPWKFFFQSKAQAYPRQKSKPFFWRALVKTM